MAALKLNGTTPPAPVSAVAAAPVTMLATVLVGAIAGYGFHLIGVPAGFLLGAMVANAALHLSGLVSGGVPDLLLIPAFVVLGMMVGVRFRDFGAALLRQVLAAGVAGFVVSLTVAVAGAVLASNLTGLPLLATLLAFAPGGL